MIARDNHTHEQLNHAAHQRLKRDGALPEHGVRVADREYAPGDRIASQLREILARLNDPLAPRTALDDVVTQPPGATGYDRYDAAALYEIALHLNLGWAVIAQIAIESRRQRATCLRQRSGGPLSAPLPVRRDHSR